MLRPNSASSRPSAPTAHRICHQRAQRQCGMTTISCSPTCDHWGRSTTCGRTRTSRSTLWTSSSARATASRERRPCTPPARSSSAASCSTRLAARSTRERIRGIVIVAIERALPVTSPAYDLGATEDELRESNLRRLTGRSSELSPRAQDVRRLSLISIGRVQSTIHSVLGQRRRRSSQFPRPGGHSGCQMAPRVLGQRWRSTQHAPMTESDSRFTIAGVGLDSESAERLPVTTAG